MLIRIFGLTLTLSTVSAYAHPVIYKDGIVVSSSNMVHGTRDDNARNSTRGDDYPNVKILLS